MALDLKPTAPLLALRPYQQEAIAQIVQAFSAKRNFVLIQAATGAGKTIVFCKIGRAHV